MNKLLLLTAAFISPLYVAAVHLQSDTVYVSEFGMKPYSYENATPMLQQAVQACKARNAKVLAFDTGRYDFWPEGAERREWFISNTSTETECPSKIKTVGLLLEDMANLTVEGNGATLVFHGKMVTMAVARSHNVALQNLHVDFERPTMSEMTYAVSDTTGTTVKFHKDVRYEIDDARRIHLFGEGWRSNIYHCIEYNPETGRSMYSRGWGILSESRATEIEPGVVHFATPADFAPQTGNSLSVRDIIRDQVGVFLYESEDVSLQNVNMHYMHGLGIVSQYSRNITMQSVNCMPRENSGRLIASSADFMHFSGCSGKIGIYDCTFAGAHDDPVNVHGTNLRVVEKLGKNRLKVRFMHGQSYGFNAFSPGDTVAFVRAETMERFSDAAVKKVRRIDDRLIDITFDRALPVDLLVDSDCVENITCTPELEIRRCRFSRTNTRGTLVTTPRKVVIADNFYCKTGMSGILIEGDAEGWFESGPVCDVLIENNTFVDCAYGGGPSNAVIALNPSNRKVDPECPVHRNVRILGNRFVTFGNPVLYAKSTAGLRFEGNKVVVVPAEEIIAAGDAAVNGYFSDADWTEMGGCDSQIILVGCKDAVIRDNTIAE